MSDDLDRKIRHADPLAEVDEPRLSEETRDGMVAEIVGMVDPDPPTQNPARRRGRSGFFLRFGGVVGLAAVIAAVLLLTGGSSKHESSSAYAAELVEFAESTPLVLLDKPGWKVVYIDGSDERDGTMTFVSDPPEGPRVSAELFWTTYWDLDSWLDDRRSSASTLSTDTPVLDTEAEVLDYGFDRGRQDITAVWELDGRVLELRSLVPNEALYYELLESLKQVDADTWLDAMPASVVRSPDRASTVEKMLRGIPVPLDFDPGIIQDANTTTSRHHLAAEVASTVGCVWIQRWSEARRSGDKKAEQAAVEAMATSKSWPILIEISHQGGFSGVFWSTVRQMVNETNGIGPGFVEESANGALGCYYVGVPLRSDEGEPLGDGLIYSYTEPGGS